MVDFISPNYLGNLADFRARYVLPVTNGTTLDSSNSERRQARKKLWVLHRLLDPLVLRATIDSVDWSTRSDFPRQNTTGLGKKLEFTIKCRLTPLQHKLYLQYLEFYGIPTTPSPTTVASRPTFSNLVTLSSKPDEHLGNILRRWYELLLVINHPSIVRTVLERELQEAPVSGVEGHTVCVPSDQAQVTRDSKSPGTLISPIRIGDSGEMDEEEDVVEVRRVLTIPSKEPKPALSRESKISDIVLPDLQSFSGMCDHVFQSLQRRRYQLH